MLKTSSQELLHTFSGHKDEKFSYHRASSQGHGSSQHKGNVRSRMGLTEEAVPDLLKREDEIKRAFRSKGLDLRLNERISVVSADLSFVLILRVLI